MGAAVVVNDSTFKDEVLMVSEPVLVDFGATWCAPCKALEPVIEELAQEYAGRIKVSKADYDEAPEAVETYRVRSLPTILFFKDGEVTDTIVGAVPKKKLAEKFDAMLT